MGITSHNLALALDDFLRLTNPDHETRRQTEDILGSHRIPPMPPFLTKLALLRLEAEQEVDRLLALMDAIDGDPDLEPYLAGAPSDFTGELLDGEQDAADEPEGDLDDDEPTHGSTSSHYLNGTEWFTCSGRISDDEREEENEHGGDVQDVPHDEPNGTVDDEFSWPESTGAGPRRMTTFEGSDDAEDSFDAEVSAPEREGGGFNRAGSAADDHEDGADDEPSFGWRGEGDEPSYWCGRGDAMELEATAPERYGAGFEVCIARTDDDEDGDTGIADAGGVSEQWQRYRGIILFVNGGPTMDPALLDDEYCLITDGHCMEPEIYHKTPVLFDRRERVSVGDLVALWFRPEVISEGRAYQVLVKRLVHLPSEGVRFPSDDRITVQMNNPPRTFQIDCRDLLAVHRCMGPVPAHRTRVRVSDGARAVGQSLHYA